MKRLDMTGNPCPIPVVEAKKVLDAENGVEVIVDNIVAVQNLQKMAKGEGYVFERKDYEGDRFLVTLIKEANMHIQQIDSAGEPEICPSNSNLVVLIRSDCMGRGSDELGRILIKGYIYTLTELEKPPKTVMFLNSGVHLTTDGANTVADLKKLEDKGAEILSCGTCLNYYNLTEKLEVGSITDMMGISQRLADAERLITI